MKINGTLTTKSNSWNGIKKHVDRNWKTDKNERYIDKSLSKFNIHDKNENIKFTNDTYKNELIKKHYSSFIAKRNLHFKKQGHPNREQSLQEYLKNKTPTAIGIATFGTLNDKKLMQARINLAYNKRSMSENDTRYYQCASWGLKRYMHSFNRRNKHVKVTHWWTNVDELGAPHVHFEMLPLGYTKLDKNGHPTKPHITAYKSGKRKGQLHHVTGSKPTGDLTRAIEMEMGTNNNRQAFKLWNDRETKAIVRIVGQTFHKRFSKVPNWSFKRQHTGRQGSLSMNSYKATWNEIDHKRRILKDREDRINKKEKDFSPLNDDYNRYSVAVPKLKEKNKDLKDQNNNLQISINQKQNTIQHLNQQKSDLTKFIQELKDKKKNLKSWLHKKWTHYKRTHLNGLYHGLARGIKYLFPGIRKIVENPKNKNTYMDFATSKVTWGNKSKGYVGGLKLFIRGLKAKGKGFFGHYKNKSDLENSFKNTKSKTPKTPGNDSDLTP